MFALDEYMITFKEALTNGHNKQLVYKFQEYVLREYNIYLRQYKELYKVEDNKTIKQEKTKDR